MKLHLLLAGIIVPVFTGCGKEAPVETVFFTASDDVEISGSLSGSGPIGIVLAHGLKYIDGKDSYLSEVSYFGEQGLIALSFSFRGYPAESIPPMAKGRDKDILAAGAFMAGRGCEKVFVLGGSMGGWIALDAAAALAEKPWFAGLILVSAGNPGAADGLAFPKLFIAAEDDPAILGRVRAMHATAAHPKKIIVFETGGHGQALFKTRRDELLAEIVRFVKQTD